MSQSQSPEIPRPGMNAPQLPIRPVLPVITRTVVRPRVAIRTVLRPVTKAQTANPRRAARQTTLKEARPRLPMKRRPPRTRTHKNSRRLIRKKSQPIPRVIPMEVLPVRPTTRARSHQMKATAAILMGRRRDRRRRRRRTEALAESRLRIRLTRGIATDDLLLDRIHDRLHVLPTFGQVGLVFD